MWIKSSAELTEKAFLATTAVSSHLLLLGERAGIVDLAQLVTVLSHFAPERSFNLKALTELYELVSAFDEHLKAAETP